MGYAQLNQKSPGDGIFKYNFCGWSDPPSSEFCLKDVLFGGEVGGLCYFCFERAVHGPSAGNLLQLCLRAPLWDYASLNYSQSEAFCGECVALDLLHNFCHLLLLILCFYSYLFVLLN